MRYILSLVLFGLVIYANAAEYSIIDFGAKPGETKLSTIAIQNAIDAEDVDGLIIRDVVNTIPNSPETLIRVKDVRNEYFEVGPDIDEEAVERL